jgi:hypothetical protein
MRVVTACGCHVPHVGVEVALTVRTIVLRVDQRDFLWATCEHIPQVVQMPLEGTLAGGGSSTLGTRGVAEIALHDQALGPRQVLDALDSFGRIGHIFAWPKAVYGSR